VVFVVLPNDDRPGISRRRTDHILPSRLVPGSWQSPRRALRGPQTVENTAPTSRSLMACMGLCGRVRVHPASPYIDFPQEHSSPPSASSIMHPLPETPLQPRIHSPNYYSHTSLLIHSHTHKMPCNACNCEFKTFCHSIQT